MYIHFIEQNSHCKTFSLFILSNYFMFYVITQLNYCFSNASFQFGDFDLNKRNHSHP